MLKKLIKKEIKTVLCELKSNYFTSPFQSSTVLSIANYFNSSWNTLTNRPLDSTVDYEFWKDVVLKMLHGNFVYYVHGLNILEDVPSIPTNDFQYRKTGDIVARNLAIALKHKANQSVYGTD
jgi:hypothetical protein